MKMKFGAIVVDGRNKIGGHVASKNRAGAYLRTKVTPVNPQTQYQNNVRAIMTNFAQTWRTLTAAQRNAWNSVVGDFARTDIFGDIRNPSGFNLYMRLNLNAGLAGGGAIASPPAISEVYAPQTIAVSAAAAVPELELTYNDVITAGQLMFIWVTPQLSAGKFFVKSEYRLLITIAPANVSPYDMLATYVARFGALVAGQKIFVKIQGVDPDTGLVSQAISTSVIVAA